MLNSELNRIAFWWAFPDRKVSRERDMYIVVNIVKLSSTCCWRADQLKLNRVLVLLSGSIKGRLEVLCYLEVDGPGWPLEVASGFLELEPIGAAWRWRWAAAAEGGMALSSQSWSGLRGDFRCSGFVGELRPLCTELELFWPLDEAPVRRLFLRFRQQE